MKKKISLTKSICICLLLVAGSLALNSAVATQKALAAPDSCTPPTTTYGSDTMSVYIPSPGIYTIWTRMEAASSSANSIMLDIDSGTASPSCYNVGGDSSIPTDGSTWDWVDDYDGSTANLVNVNLTQGTHTFELIGTESGVSVDRLIALPTATVNDVQTQTPSCIPDNTQDDTAGNNCAAIDNTSSGPPTVAITSPSGGTVNGTTTINVTATDADPSNTQEGIASVQFELDGIPLPTNTANPDNPVVVPSSGSTYSYSWDTTAATNISHTLTAIATDDSGATASTSVTVTVDNTTGSNGTLTAPTNPQVTARSGRTLSLSWTGSTDSGGPGVVGYYLYRNGSSSPTATVAGTTYTDTSLTPGTSYTYTVAAYNNATSGNISPLSASVNSTTCILGDIKCNGGPVGLSDLILLSQNWGNTSGTATWSQGSMTPGGDVGLSDLIILSQTWGNQGP